MYDSGTVFSKYIVHQKETSQKSKDFSHSSKQDYDRRERYVYQPKKKSYHRSQSPHHQQESHRREKGDYDRDISTRHKSHSSFKSQPRK